MEKFEILGEMFKSEKEYLDFVVKNEDLIIRSKKSAMKKADGFSSHSVVQRPIGAKKSLDGESDTAGQVKVKVIINSTNILDSHKDVHIPGLWSKSLKESGNRILHLQEHGRRFKDVIARGDDLKAYTETSSWKNIGFDLEGKTELLVFDSTVKESRNPEMYREYKDGNVTEHSVGMYYVKIATCINDEDYPLQKENWDKYAPMIANKAELEKTKLFWAVTEAKAIEGSAVLIGSNSFTPTLTTSKDEVVEEDIKKDAILKWLG